MQSRLQPLESVGFLFLLFVAAGLLFPACDKDTEWRVVEPLASAKEATKVPTNPPEKKRPPAPPQNEPLIHLPPVSPTRLEAPAPPPPPPANEEVQPPPPVAEPPKPEPEAVTTIQDRSLVEIEEPKLPIPPPLPSTPGFQPRADTFNCLQDRKWATTQNEVRDFDEPMDGEKIISCDNLGTTILRVGKNFLLRRWSRERLPIHFKAHQSLPKKAIDVLDEVANRINNSALAAGVLQYLNLNSLIEIEPGFTTERANLNQADETAVIEFQNWTDATQKPTTARAWPWPSASRTGELIDADIVVYWNIVQDDAKNRSTNPADLWKFFEYVIMHEMLHTLGFSHNFAGAQYGSPIDYPYGNEIPKAEMGPYDLEVLQYLYTDKVEGFHRWQLKRSDPTRQRPEVLQASKLKN